MIGDNQLGHGVEILGKGGNTITGVVVEVDIGGSVLLDPDDGGRAWHVNGRAIDFWRTCCGCPEPMRPWQCLATTAPPLRMPVAAGTEPW